MARRPYVELFFVSFLILFFELAAIRWFASTVVFLTFFTNIVLLACFLGMSVGLLIARQPRRWIVSTLPLAVLSLALAILIFIFYERSSGSLTVSLGGQGSPQLIYFGTEYRPADPSRWVIPIWVIGGAFFTLIALTFIGPGQVMGRAFAAIPDRVRAYSTDILGSLAGIASFAAISYLELPPEAWFLPVALLLLYFTGWRDRVQIASAIAVVLLAAIGAHALVAHGPQTYWSPYYKISYAPETRTINTNNIGHQQMHAVGGDAPAYLIPYLLNQQAGGKPIEDVLVIGAGSGNDVAAALAAGAARIDAIEIDPRILELGRRYHPNRPYADPRVSVHLDDGRSFLRRTERKYDLVIYALVDSLVLHSGYSSLRLENFLFTEEALADVARVLKPDGVFAMYNYYRKGWVVERLAKMATEAFHDSPLVINLPYRDEIRAEDQQTDQITFVLAGGHAGRFRAIRASFERSGGFSLNVGPAKPEKTAGGAAPSAGQRIGPSHVDVAHVDRVPSDDWPQLYLRSREIPWAPIGQGMVTMGVLSLLILLAVGRPRQLRPHARMFFLGAGFMLLETKSVVHMALLFGSTWVVNSVVFFAILIMILCANLFVLRVRPVRLWPYYALLVAALLVNVIVPMHVFLSLPPVMRTIASCAVVFVPIFFAGVVFATTFRESREPDIAFGSNVAGIIVGGLSEQLSLVLGFSSLLLVAVAYYLLAFVLGRRARAPA
jgi:SAM-dependent methyltransferase